MSKIVELDLESEDMINQLLRLQRVSYRQEELLLGFPIPRTEDTAADLLDSGEVFVGMVQDGDLLGFFSFAADETTLDIHRVAVDPDYFRQGVATELLLFLFEAFSGISRFLVTTGASNAPAIGLYEKLGFRIIESFEPVPGLIMVRMERCPIGDHDAVT